MNSLILTFLRLSCRASDLSSVARAGAIVALIFSAGLTTAAVAQDAKPMFMFVQSAEDIKVDKNAQTIRLVKVNPQTIYFTDRPVRMGGHIKLEDYLKEWTSKAGADNFSKDPPNAAISVFESGKSNNTLAVVEIRNPKVDGADLVYNYKIIEGALPEGGGATSLFIDWIGVGGGVGVGFHGVGVGFRGPGFR